MSDLPSDPALLRQTVMALSSRLAALSEECSTLATERDAAIAQRDAAIQENDKLLMIVSVTRGSPVPGLDLRGMLWIARSG
jgi:uncharacterized small protein (DUF1192 family)